MGREQETILKAAFGVAAIAVRPSLLDIDGRAIRMRSARPALRPIGSADGGEPQAPHSVRRFGEVRLRKMGCGR